jgi:opacity protein-like surface antigen
MKTYNLITICLICILAFSAQNVIIASDLTADLGISLTHPRGEFGDRFGSEYGPNLAFEYMYNDYLGFRASMEYQRYTRSHFKKDLTLYPITLDGQVAYPVYKNTRVFAALGMGMYLCETENAWWGDGRSEDSTNIGFNYGLGADYWITDRIGVFMSYFQHKVHVGDSSGTLSWSDWTTGVRVSFGSFGN